MPERPKWECPTCGAEADWTCGHGYSCPAKHRWSFWVRMDDTDEEIEAEMRREFEGPLTITGRLGHLAIEMDHRRGECRVCQAS